MILTQLRTYFLSQVHDGVHIVSAFQRTCGLSWTSTPVQQPSSISTSINNNQPDDIKQPTPPRHQDGSGNNNNNNTNNNNNNKINTTTTNHTTTTHTTTKQTYHIGHPLLHYLMLLGAALGNEAMFASFLPFLYWNISWPLARHMIVVWFFSEYIGQVIKDLLCLPRPKTPPVIRLEQYYETEYGLPSTHAMVAVSMSNYLLLHFSIQHQWFHHFSQLLRIFFTRGEILGGEITTTKAAMFLLGFLLVVSWCFLTCLSRLYLGVHSLIDIHVGLALGYLCVLVEMQLIPVVDRLVVRHESYVVPLMIIVCFVSLLAVYPRNRRVWSSSFGDTARVLGVSCGCFLADWLHGQLTATDPSPFHYTSNTSIGGIGSMATVILLRGVVGYGLMFLAKGITKKVTYAVMPRIVHWLRIGEAHIDGVENCHRYLIEVPCVFITYAHIGFTAVYTGPVVMHALSIPI